MMNLSEKTIVYKKLKSSEILIGTILQIYKIEGNRKLINPSTRPNYASSGNNFKNAVMGRNANMHMGLKIYIER
jgi:hypothetical protein